VTLKRFSDYDGHLIFMKDIAILRTLGATSQTIRAIFIVQGTIIGFFGSIVGIIMGLLVALNLEDIVSFIEKTFHVSFIDKNIYYISKLPSEVLPKMIQRPE